MGVVTYIDFICLYIDYIDVANGNCPTQLGVYVHVIVFIIMLRFSMDLEKKN